MAVEILKETDRKIIFNLHDVDRFQANRFREILLADIPTVAPSKVDIRDNSSYFADEILGERVSKLVVIGSEVGDRFRLNVSNGKYPNGRLVLSNDFKRISGQGELFPELLFLKLESNQIEPQKVYLEFDTRRGTAREHKKFSPTTTVVCLRNYRTSSGKLLTERQVRIEGLMKDVEEDQSYYFSVGLTGTLSGSKVLELAIVLFKDLQTKNTPSEEGESDE